MLIGVLSLIAVFAASITAIVILGKRNIFESVAVGTALLMCLHVVISFVLFTIDKYSVLRTVSTMFIVSTLTLTATLLLKKGKKFVCDTSVRNALIPIIICVFLVPFVSLKNGCYGMGQDEGGYQVQALYYMSGDTSAVKDFEGYYDLSEEDRETFKQSIDYTNGFDALREGYKDPNYHEGISPSLRYIHGIPSFSALMATWGSIFGPEDIQGVQTLIYVLLIFLTYFVTVRLGFSKVYSCLSCFAVGFSPAVIWLMKSSLTESFMALLIMLFLWLLTTDTKWSDILSIVPVAVYGMYHVSFYTIVPLFIGVYAFRYIATAEKKYVGLMYAMPALQVMSFFTMSRIQPIYTRNNYMRLFVIKGAEHSVSDLDGQVILVALIYMFVISLFTIFIGKFLRNNNRLLILGKNKMFRWGLRVLIAVPILKIVIGLMRADFPTALDALKQFMRTTFYNYAMAGGLILFVAAIVLALVRPSDMIKDNKTSTLSIMFFYLVLVYSAFLNGFAHPLMYYTRYLVPFLSVAVLFVMFVLNERKNIKAYITVPVFVLCMSIFVPTNMSLLTSRDDTKVTWEVMNSITELFDEDDAVIVAENSRLVMWAGIDAMTDADVYPQYKDFEEMAVDLWNDHKDIYVIKRYPMYDTDTEFELVYMNTYDYEEDCTRDPFPVTLYPTDFSSREETIYVYRMAHTDLREYPISDFYDSYTGLAGYELTYAWTGSEVVELNCDLEDRDYTMTVDLMPGIPFGAAENGCISIDVYINDEFIDTVTLAPGVNEEGFTLQIDDEMFDEGDNVIRFESNLWDASINNPADPRQLGFAIENVTFVS